LCGKADHLVQQIGVVGLFHERRRFIISSVSVGPRFAACCSPNRESPMTTAKLHHHPGRDRLGHDNLPRSHRRFTSADRS
jgi:hypothetical protein